ncbi:MAG TPA: hypothetical protein VHG29_13115 [Novosphingobium sp.]|nr:hypothetical protein [Novosphingobium sp.]
MKSSILLLMAAASLPLGACTNMGSDRTLASAGTGAAIGAAGGAGIAAIAGGDLLTGALIGGAVGGLAGAVWADRDNDGRADGYYRGGQYYAGEPGQYQSASAPTCRSVGGTALTGAGVGAAAGAGVGLLASGVGVLEGALVGAAVGGLAGAVWADSNNDGCADGYTREGRYYSGGPVVQPIPYRTGERG